MKIIFAAFALISTISTTVAQIPFPKSFNNFPPVVATVNGEQFKLADWASLESGGQGPIQSCRLFGFPTVDGVLVDVTIDDSKSMKLLELATYSRNCFRPMVVDLSHTNGSPGGANTLGALLIVREHSSCVIGITRGGFACNYTNTTSKNVFFSEALAALVSNWLQASGQKLEKEHYDRLSGRSIIAEKSNFLKRLQKYSLPAKNRDQETDKTKVPDKTEVSGAQNETD